jgi:hypothetical protein
MANRFQLEVRGFKEAQQAFRDVVKAVDPATSPGELRGLYRIARSQIVSALADAGRFLRDKARSNAMVMRAPKRLYSGARPAIFAFSDFDAARDDKRKRSVLVGVRTGLASRAKDERLFVKWGVGAKRRKDGSTASRGLAMSFGTLYEKGTANGRVRARHYFSNAVNTTKHSIMGLVAQAYRRAASLLNSTTSK